MRIYVASSWRNAKQQEVVKVLRDAGHEVYDFKNPGRGKSGFSWADIDPNWKQWTNEQYKEALTHPVAIAGFANDFNAMKWADVCVMVLPCGASAHSECGWMAGAGKTTIVLMGDEQQPELMYKLYDFVTDNIDIVVKFCNKMEVQKYI